MKLNIFECKIFTIKCGKLLMSLMPSLKTLADHTNGNMLMSCDSESQICVALIKL